MAATAHASLVSLFHTMDQIQTHPRLPTYFDNNQFQSLREMVDFFVDFVENFPEAEDLMRRIGDAAHEAEDIIEVEAADRIRDKSTTRSVTMLLHLQRIIQDISSIKDEVIKFKDEAGFKNSMPPPSSSSSSSSSSSTPYATQKTSILGFERHVAKLLDELIGDNCRTILPIVGMGGVGKTTLARNLYEHSVVVYHFDVRAWVTVSQEYNASDMISQALSCLGRSSKDKSNDQKGEELYKTLSGRRYLIVLDDAWSVEAWEKIKFFFPQNDNGSRIVVTTRQQELVNYFGSSSLAVDFLDYKNSSKLFCEVTFAEQECPPQLKQIAEKIVQKCKGLPLAIRVIGGLLSNLPRTQEYWEKIAKDKSLVMEYSGDGNKPSSILYMSYKHLPVSLRSCFLYLGLFPEDSKINASRLIKLWVAEGFIKPTKNQTLEQVAEGYIKELIDRNLLLVGKMTEYKKVESYFLHDLVRELCIKMAEKEKFYWVQRHIFMGGHHIVEQRATSFYGREYFYGIPKTQREAPSKSRLLRVLIERDYCVEPSFQQVNLRYMYHTHNPPRPPISSSISLCWSLQTLIMEESYGLVLPSEIWKMSQLRHIQISEMRIRDPPSSDVFVLHNLQTLKRVMNLIFTEEVCARIPNIRELHISCSFAKQVLVSCGKYHLHNVGSLTKLESLEVTSMGGAYDPFQTLDLPNSLRELSLNNCNIAWSGMVTIASLPRLQLLELGDKAVGLVEWNFVKEEFRCLKHLRIYGFDLVIWNADRSNFPILETLYLSYLEKLVEIPSNIGEIPTLEKILIRECSESACMSAIEILEEQENLGNETLQVKIQLCCRETWKKKVQTRIKRIIERYKSQNLHVDPQLTDLPRGPNILTRPWKVPLPSRISFPPASASASATEKQKAEMEL